LNPTPMKVSQTMIASSAGVAMRAVAGIWNTTGMIPVMLDRNTKKKIESR
jgi:hypothetical protein